jgi:hypothetical protein
MTDRELIAQARSYANQLAASVHFDHPGALLVDRLADALESTSVKLESARAELDEAEGAKEKPGPTGSYTVRVPKDTSGKFTRDKPKGKIIVNKEK